MTDRDDIPLGFTYDSDGRELTYKNSDGYWREHTYDAQGRELTYKNSSGYWHEYTRDANGRVLTYKREGFTGTRIADDGYYVLLHDAEKGLFKAGCRLFTRAEALEHWDRGDERAKLFTRAIQLLGG